MGLIKNIVFDLGGVLVDFDPERCMAALGFSDAAAEAFRKEIFSGFWVSCDLMPYDDAEIRSLFKARVPGYEAEVDRLWDDLHPITGVRAYTRGWIASLKARGYRVYILSNYGRRSFEINSELYDFLALTDGFLISYQVQKVKPDPEIYRILCGRFDIAPEESVFLDDRAVNVEAAEALGFYGIVFDSYAQASAALDSLLTDGSG